MSGWFDSIGARAPCARTVASDGRAVVGAGAFTTASVWVGLALSLSAVLPGTDAVAQPADRPIRLVVP
jgi:hypothetical protein